MAQSSFFFHNVGTVGAGVDFKARIDILAVEETIEVVRFLEEIEQGDYSSLLSSLLARCLQ